MTHPLPEPVAAYFAATGPSEIADCFTDDAVVTDERRIHRGRAEILNWREEVARISFHQEILRSRQDGESLVVTCRLTGDFKGSPVELDYAFRLAGDRIGRLEIA